MKAQGYGPAEQRRFLVINYWIGSHGNGYLDGPVLVSTGDYEQFFLWDEPYGVELAASEYQIVELYPRGLTFDEASRRFAREFPSAIGGSAPGQNLAREQALWQEVAHPTSLLCIAAA